MSAVFHIKKRLSYKESIPTLSVYVLNEKTNSPCKWLFILLEQQLLKFKEKLFNSFWLHSWQDTAWKLQSHRLSSSLLCSANCSRLPLSFRLQKGRTGYVLLCSLGTGQIHRRQKSKLRRANIELLARQRLEKVQSHLLSLCVSFRGQDLRLCCRLPQLKQPSFPLLWPHGWSGRAQRPHDWQCLHAWREKT